jgi:hypothetical protein
VARSGAVHASRAPRGAAADPEIDAEPAAASEGEADGATARDGEADHEAGAEAIETPAQTQMSTHAWG